MSEPVWITVWQVIIFNEELIREFGGLAIGAVNQDLLKMALARPQQKWNYKKWDLYHLAASYSFAIAKNHPFVDGNKRTAYVVAIEFLKANGIDCAPSQSEIVREMLALACDETNEAGFAAWLAA